MTTLTPRVSDLSSVKTAQRSLDPVTEAPLVSREERDTERGLSSQLAMVLTRDPRAIYISERLG